MEINVTFNTQMNKIFTSGGYNSRHVLRAPPNRGSSLLNITRAAADAHFTQCGRAAGCRFLSKSAHLITALQAPACLVCPFLVMEIEQVVALTD